MGRPPGAKNKAHYDGRTYSMNDNVEAATKGTGRPTTGFFYCEMCPDLVFDGKMNLKRHMNYCHILQKWCDICEKRPRHSFELHMLRYHSDKGHKCDVCDATFKTYSNLRAHMLIHSTEKKFLCAICGRSFISMTLCVRHEDFVHKDIRKFNCQYCERSFYFRYRLQDHINAFHTMERPHQCDICGKGFSSRNYARIHMLTHGEKTLQCRYCDKMFKLSGNRRKHETAVHKVAKGIMLD